MVSDPKSSVRLAEGLAVLLPALCACQTKFCGTAVLLVLEYVLAPSCKTGELMPTARVAAVASRLTVPRKVLAPFTSNRVAGETVPMPIFAPYWAINELPRVDDVDQIGKKPEVPLPDVFDVPTIGRGTPTIGRGTPTIG